MRFRRLCLIVLAGAFFGNLAQAAEVCGKPSKAGIKRCEHLLHEKDSQATIFKTIYYVDRAQNITEWEINFPRKGGDATYQFLMVAGAIGVLVPQFPTDKRLDFIKLLLVNAAEANPKFIPLGRYDWTSMRTDADFMIRAMRNKSG